MSKPLDYNTVKLYIESQGYQMLQDFIIDNKTKIKMSCPRGHEVEISWGNFKSNGRRCRFCKIEDSRTPISEIIEMFSKYGYKYIKECGSDVNGRRVIVECPRKHTYEVSVNKFKLGRRCPICYNTRFNYKYVQSFVKNSGYQLMTETYVNANQKLELICPNGHICQISFHNFKNGGRRCPICTKSKGEMKVASLLDICGISFTQQYRIEECRNRLPLPFDFYIPSLNMCIEFDGRQHFEPVDVFGGVDGFNKTQKNDSIKNQYCIDNNIKLIRIPYWDFDNIEKILNKELKL